MAGDGNPLETVLAHQILEGQLQLDLALGGAAGVGGAVRYWDLLQKRWRALIWTVRNVSSTTYDSMFMLLWTFFPPLSIQVKSVFWCSKVHEMKTNIKLVFLSRG